MSRATEPAATEPGTNGACGGSGTRRSSAAESWPTWGSVDRIIAEAAAKARAEDRLSPREHEVVVVAQALSNREVARRLVLSERTAEAHVRVFAGG